MKKTLLYFLVLSSCFLLLFAGCTKQIEFDGDETEPLPVMVSYVEADTAFGVKMTYSRFFLSGRDFKSINDATIRAEVNGAPSAMAFARVGEGYYLSSMALHAGDTMTLHVAVPGEGEVSAGCRLPAVPVVSDVKATDEGGYSVGFSFVLHDPAARGDCYMLRAWCVDSATGERTQYVVSVDDDVIYDVDVSDEVIDLETSTDYSYGWQVLFTDERINGQNHTVKGTLESGFGQTGQTIQLQICAVSRDTYLYLATLRSQQESGGGISFIGEPVQIHTNVKGGIGILGAVSPRTEELITVGVQNENTDYR